MLNGHKNGYHTCIAVFYRIGETMLKRLLIMLVFMHSALSAADWLYLQGSEPEGIKQQHRLWGFLHFRYEKQEGDPLVVEGIDKTPFVYTRPALTHQEGFNMARFRIGLRGSLDQHRRIDYFLLSDFGNNGVTRPGRHRMNVHLTDASLTFKHFPIYIRAGKFKYPGSEEGWMARFVSPFIDFTTLSNQLMMERFISAESRSGTTYTGEPSSGVGAFRDSGVQLFGRIDTASQSHISLAYIAGTGCGISYHDCNDGNPTHYLYGAYDKRLGGGKGYYGEALKLYAWYQEGRRVMEFADESRAYDRQRYGTGFTFFHSGFRAQGEYVKAEGMIFTGAKDYDPDPLEVSWNFQIEAEGKATGYYLLVGQRFLDEFNLALRYDAYTRMEDSFEKRREFKTWTAAASWLISKHARLDFNYAVNRYDAPYNTTADKVLERMGDKFMVQLTLLKR